MSANRYATRTRELRLRNGRIAYVTGASRASLSHYAERYETIDLGNCVLDLRELISWEIVCLVDEM